MPPVLQDLKPSPRDASRQELGLRQRVEQFLVPDEHQRGRPDPVQVPRGVMPQDRLGLPDQAVDRRRILGRSPAEVRDEPSRIHIEVPCAGIHCRASWVMEPGGRASD